MNADEITADMNIFLKQLAAWAGIAVPSFIGALLILLIGWWIAGRAERAMSRLMASQSRIDATLKGVIASAVRYAILIVVIVAVLSQLGIQTTSILAALGAAGLAIGLAIQGTLQNIAAGMMLLWLRPFKVDEYIDTGSVAGTVKQVGLFASELHTWDGIFLFVPNSQLWNTRIINYSRLSTRLVDLKFGVAYGDDVAKGKQVLLDLAAADDRIRREPEPLVFVDDLGDSAVVLALRVWASNSDYWAVRRALTEGGKSALESAGLSIPFPQRDVHLYEQSPVQGTRAA
jgi:small conductance mechanosensitive channel